MLSMAVFSRKVIDPHMGQGGCTHLMRGCSRMYYHGPLHSYCRDGGRRVFTDQAEIACLRQALCEEGGKRRGRGRVVLVSWGAEGRGELKVAGGSERWWERGGGVLV